jgi:hypothetical protein
MSRNRPRFPSSSMGFVGKDIVFDEYEGVKSATGWIAIAKNKWIPAWACDPYATVPPIIVPSLGIRQTFGNEDRAWGYKPDKRNYGSFAIIWLLPERPEGFINKPAGFKLQQRHIDYCLALNGGNQKKVNWLVDDNGTRKILALDDGQYKCPVPCCSGSNPVNVLEIDGNFARVQTLSIYDPLPDPTTLPDYLCHRWWAFTVGGVYYMQESITGGIRYPLFAYGNSAWMQLPALLGA